MESVEDVKNEVFQHFANKFVEEDHMRSVQDGAVFKSLSGEDRGDLESPFLEDEVK